MSFRALPVHVRTARLVAVTVARRAGWPEDVVESVRHGVGEACTLALAGCDRDDVITVELSEDGPGLTARIWPVGQVGDDAPGGLPEAVLSGLTDEKGIEQHDGRGVLRLSWVA